MKRLIRILSVLIALCQALPALAVTDKEMEQARVIATQTYLRYANDGSGYLDALHPKTMAELEKSLKAKEKENIKAFKAIPVPSGYASWDKQQLVDYWSTKAFSHSGLQPKGLAAGKAAARKKLNAMTVSAPAPAAATPEKKPAPTEQKTAAAPAEQKPAAATPTPPTETDQKSIPASEAALDSAQAALDESKILAEAALADEDPTIPKESSHTWIYVVVLCILVAVVVALVVFASNVMKKSGGDAAWNQATADNSKALARSLKEANNRAEELEKQNKQLKKQVDALTAEINRLRAQSSQNGTPQAPIIGIPTTKSTPAHEPAAAPQQPRPAAQPQSTQPRPTAQPQSTQPRPAAQPQSTQPHQQVAAPSQQTQNRTIYLGRANAKLIFIRADRTLNPEHSVYRLDTSDGLAGTFKVVNDPSVIERVKQDPALTLSAACVGPDLGDTSGLQKIVTDSAGTATFAGGRWIVMRKAKIHYE